MVQPAGGGVTGSDLGVVWLYESKGGVQRRGGRQLVLAVKELAPDLWRDSEDFGFEFGGSWENFVV